MSLRKRKWLGRALLLALAGAIAGCDKAPTTLRIVSGPPAANQEVAMLLAGASAGVQTRVRLRAGPSVEDAEAALDALAAGTADLALVENSSSFRNPALRTVAPLYPSVLHIGVKPERRGRALRDIFADAKVYAGGDDTAARQLLDRMAAIYSWAGIQFTYVDALDSDPDVIFVFAPISPADVPLLEGYELLSLGRVEDVGVGSLADGLSLVAPLLRPFVIPEGTYGALTPLPVATVAVDMLLVARADTPRVVVYDLVEAIQVMGPLLFAQRPDLEIDRLEHFDISHLTFPVHAGALAFRARNDPGFFERAAGIFEVVVTSIAALGTAFLALLRAWYARKKARIDDLYAAALAVRAKHTPELTAQQREECVAELRKLRDHAFSLLIEEKLSADESFRILQTLVYNIIDEFEQSGRRAKS